MDLILRDKNFKKKNVIKKPEFSCNSGLYGASANDFELTLPESEGIMPIGDFITYGISEFGGKILERITDTAEKTVKYIGKTFRGQMENSIVAPFSVLSLTGTDYDIISALFALSQLDYKIQSANYTSEKTILFSIGTNLLKAADLTMNAFNEKMLFQVSNDGVEITLAPISEMSFDASQVDLTADENSLLPTALHAKGNKNYSVSVYLQGDGTVGTKRYFTGMDAIEIWEEFSDEGESLTEFTTLVSERLLALRKSENASEVNAKINDADIGDKINITINKYGIKTSQTVTEKILKIEGKNKQITFNTGG